MLDVGLSEILLIAIVAIVFVGPDDLPKLMRLAGRYYGKLRRASDELRSAFQLEVDRVEADARAEEIRRRREELLARRKAQAAQTGPEPLPQPRPQDTPVPVPLAPATPEAAVAAPAPAQEPTLTPDVDSIFPRTDGDAPVPRPSTQDPS